MRTETQTIRIGENMGPIDWTHPIAKAKPEFWREAETNPDAFLFRGHTILALAMYDGWPYWTPRPAIQFVGPLNSAEWTFFDSYSAHAGSLDRKREIA
jgi:hypothetical protein